MYRMDNNTFRLTKFNVRGMVKDCAIVVIAKRGSGKSFLVRDLMYYMKDIPTGIVINPTERKNPTFVEFFPDLFIHYEITPQIFAGIIARQNLLCEKIRDLKKKNKTADMRTILVMDDCLSKKEVWAKDENIREIMMNGRHYKITYVLTMQYSMGITPELRANFDYIFLLKEDFISNKKKLYEHYAGMFPSYNAFETVFRTCTNEHCCMVVDNRKPSENINEKVYWYKAEIPPEFKFGADFFWKYHEKYFDPDFFKKINTGYDIIKNGPKRGQNFKVQKV